MGAPRLPVGLVAVVKHDCATCQTVAPVLLELARRTDLTVYCQDDPEFPAGLEVTDDTDLAVSWHHSIETVPTLIAVGSDGERERTVGWSIEQWRRITGLDDLAGDLDIPSQRPGCGSLSVDPDLIDELRVRHSGSTLRARRLDLAEMEDEFEYMHRVGWSDGLPLVPPTESRVLAMLEGTTRSPEELVAVVPPDLVDATVEKVAISAVMAGCRPEHLPWVLTAVEAACNDEFNMHGLLATTMPVGPVIICSGPGTRDIGMDPGVNALGQGNRASLSIGRALQLLVRNLGGGRPGGVDRATHGNPGKLSFCFTEHSGPFGSLASSRSDLDESVDAVTVFAGEGPRCIVDQLSREPESLATSLAENLRMMHHHKLAMAFDAVLVLGPEHLRVFTDAGWDRSRITEELMSRLQLPYDDIVRGAGGIAEGIPAGLGLETLPKFQPGGLMLAHAGGGAGLFSMLIAGWVNGDTGSKPVTRAVQY